MAETLEKRRQRPGPLAGCIAERPRASGNDRDDERRELPRRGHGDGSGAEHRGPARRSPLSRRRCAGRRPTGRFFIEPYALTAWAQSRLSSLDLGDRRIGGGRTTASIRNFFNNGARNRGWVGAGANGIPGTVDDVLTVTGETLSQVTPRVLGTASASSLFTEIPGYAAAGTRLDTRFGRHEIVVDTENLTDDNYRGLSWGMDAPGRGVSVRYGVRF